jgi:hypothetical protein
LATSGGATKKAPATGLTNCGMACTAAATPSECATMTTGLSASFTALATLAVQSSRTGFDHSACSTRRAVDSFDCQRVCQCSGPELV